MRWNFNPSAFATYFFRMKKVLLLFIALFFICSFSQNNSKNSLIVNDDEIVTFIFAGDIMGHSPQFQAAYNPKNNCFNYDICFKNVKPYIQSADFALANLEVPIAGKPYSGYPNFSSPDALLDAIKNAGFNILQTANNHALDRNRSGLERTIFQLEKRKLFHLGSYYNEIQRDSTYPLILNSKGIRIALLNCTYGTNDRKPSGLTLVNYLDTIQILQDIEKARKLGAEFQIMTVHWGTEYELQSNEIQYKYAQFFVNHGINLVIGSHPHVVQNAENLIAKDSLSVPVFYSLGNYLSNQRNLNSNGGIMVKVQISSKTKRITTISYLPVYVFRGVLNGEYQYHLIPTIDFIKHPSQFPINKSDSVSLVDFHRLTMNRLYNQHILQ